MPEIKNFTFDHTELAEILIKKLDIHEGLWGVYVEFGFTGANVITSPDGKAVSPASISFINKIGIQKFDAPNNLTVDAAQINPIQPTKPKPAPGGAPVPTLKPKRRIEVR